MYMTAKPRPISSFNLSENESASLNELLDDKDIIIKPADKGGGICIQDAVKYKQEILSQFLIVDFLRK